MKKVLAIIMFILLISTVSATTVTLDAASGPGTGFDNQFIYEYDYNDATVTVEFDSYDDNFRAHIVATGLKPSFTYQVKFEGQGSLSAYADTNEFIGLNGRWWYSGNRDDTYYWANKDTYNIIGYMVFDYITTDNNGEFDGYVETSASYHVLHCSESLYPISSEPAYDDETLKCSEDTGALCPAESVYGQIERPGFTGLPVGTYEDVIITLNEESFHVSCGTWTTAMTKEIDFEIGDYTDYLVDGDQDIIGAVYYDQCNPDGFSGEVHTEEITDGVKRHQMKLEGKPSCIYPSEEADDWANEQIGLQGRFWCTNNCPCSINPSWGGCNIDDNSLYLAHKDDPGFCAQGYILFDCAYTDDSGELHASFDVDSSYATCSSYLGEATLPDGDYNVRFLVGQDYSPWGTVGIQDLDFIIGDCSPNNDIPEFTVIGSLVVLGAAGLFIYKRRK